MSNQKVKVLSAHEAKQGNAMTVLVPVSKPRNPLHEVLKSKRAAVHGKSAKAQRQQERQRMVRNLSAIVRGDAE